MKIKNNLNRKYTQISAYVIATAVIIYILSLLAKNAPEITVVIADKLQWLFRVIKPIFLGFVIAYLFDPVVGFFEKLFGRLKHFKKKPSKLRLVSVLVTVLATIIALVALVSLLVYSVTKQIRFASVDDVVTLIGMYTQMVSDFIDGAIQSLNNLNIETEELRQVINQFTSNIINYIRPIATSVPNSIGSLTSSISTFAFGVIIAIWFLIDGRMIMNYLNKVMFALTSKKWNNRIHHFLNDADFVFSGYIRGQLMDALVMLCLISISLSLVGVRFAVLIGVVAGIGNLIPYLGPFIAYGGTAIVCLIEGKMQTLIVAVIVLFIIQTIDGNLIGPKLLSKSVEVHPLLVIIFLIFGSAIGGFLGMLMAVPVGALIKLLFVRFIDRETAKKMKLVGEESFAGKKNEHTITNE